MEDRGLCAARRRVWWSSLILGCRVVRFARVLIAVPSRGVRHSTTFKPVSILKDADGVMAGLRRIQASKSTELGYIELSYYCVSSHLPQDS